MKAIVYWPDRLTAIRVEVYRNVTKLRVHSGTRSGGYSISQGDHHTSTSSTEKCEVMLLGDDEEDIGQ